MKDPHLEPIYIANINSIHFNDLTLYRNPFENNIVK